MITNLVEMVRPQKVSDAEIIAAARAALLEHGPSAPLTKIAAALGVSAPAVLKRVGSREELLARALAPDGPTTWMARLEQPVHEAALPDALVELLVCAMEFFQELVPLLVLARAADLDLSAIAGQPQPPGARIRHAFTSWIEASRGRPRKRDPEIAAFTEALLGAIESRCVRAYLEREVMSRRRRVTWIRKLVHGLWPRLASQPRAPRRGKDR